MIKFEKMFENLTKIHDISTVFNDFLDYSIDQFLINPNLKYFDFKKYSEEEHEIFFNLFTHWVETSHEYLKTHDWFDMLGLIYEDIVQSKYKAGSKGQFFTPMSVCDALAKITYYSMNDKEDSNVLKAYDSACGSGRTLLAYHVLRPNDVCFGADLDITSCKMTCLNFLIHGVKGSVENMDSITLEWFNGWKINETLDIGIPLTIMECDNHKECNIMLGLSDDCKKIVVDDGVESKVMGSEETVVSENKTGQMTLM